MSCPIGILACPWRIGSPTWIRQPLGVVVLPSIQLTCSHRSCVVGTEDSTFSDLVVSWHSVVHWGVYIGLSGNKTGY